MENIENEKQPTLWDYFKALKYRNNDKDCKDVAKGMMVLIEKAKKGKISQKAKDELMSMLKDFVVLITPPTNFCKQSSKQSALHSNPIKYEVEKINVPNHLRSYFLLAADKQTTKTRNSSKTNQRKKCKTIHTAKTCARVCKCRTR